jgi:hypothetical protein
MLRSVFFKVANLWNVVYFLQDYTQQDPKILLDSENLTKDCGGLHFGHKKEHETRGQGKLNNEYCYDFMVTRKERNKRRH